MALSGSQNRRLDSAWLGSDRQHRSAMNAAARRAAGVFASEIADLSADVGRRGEPERRRPHRAGDAVGVGRAGARSRPTAAAAWCGLATAGSPSTCHARAIWIRFRPGSVAIPAATCGTPVVEIAPPSPCPTACGERTTARAGRGAGGLGFNAQAHIRHSAGSAWAASRETTGEGKPPERHRYVEPVGRASLRRHPGRGRRRGDQAREHRPARHDARRLTGVR